jgi:dihydrodipicolinate synthase/N-acetylneuraminate lyase
VSEKLPMVAVAKPWLGEEEAAAAREAILSGWVTQGPQVAAFEREFAEYTGATHACAVSSCTTALHLALLAVGGEGLIWVVAKAVPAATTSMVRQALAAELDEARDLLYRMLPLIEANFIETNPAPAKAALHAMGRIENELRLPLVPVSDTTLKTLLAALRAAGVERAHV